ncbi:MAG: UvrD-helicase domain-containing protein [Chloroflexi bacterium]|nr:UvrD-helicase domain-containing protein [Chloroflexota bacterium]
MAKLLPDSPHMDVSPAVARLRRAFKQLPDEQFTIWQRLPFHAQTGPDFLVLWMGQRSLWIKASDLGSTDVRTMAQSSLFAGNGGAQSPQVAYDDVCHFIEEGLGRDPCVDLAAVPAVVVFPNLTERDLAQLGQVATTPSGFTWCSKDSFASFQQFLTDHLGQPLSDEAIAHLRRVFTPEVVIPAQLTVRAPKKRNNSAQLTDSLLDYDQERILKTDLTLSDDAGAAVGDFNLRLVNGVAGSGKSLIVVYRASLLRQFFPDKSILGLTHNRPLINDLNRRYQTIRKSDDVEWLTFNQWCWKLWTTVQPDRRSTIGATEKQHLVTGIWNKTFSDTQMSDQALLEELDWCKDRLIFSLEDYLKADRTGRGFALAEPQRRRVWDAFADYQHELNRHKLIDWGDIPRQLWRWVQSGKLTVPTYDAILIDEAQFFAPIWFELIKCAVKPRTGHLFMVADPTQGFLKRRQSWVASGLDVRGRSHHLQHSYRTTRQILSFATLFYRTRVSEDDEDIVLPDFEDMPNGTFPEIVTVDGEQDEITRIMNEVGSLIKKGVSLNHILIIHTDWSGQKQILARLNTKYGANTGVDPKETLGLESIRVCTLNAVTGLESPIVFLAGTAGLLEKEQNIRISDDERQELIRDNSRKLYMAITRAGQRLVITVMGSQAESFQTLLQTVQQSTPSA